MTAVEVTPTPQRLELGGGVLRAADAVAALPPEGYILALDGGTATVAASDEAGRFYAEASPEPRDSRLRDLADGFRRAHRANGRGAIAALLREVATEAARS